MFETSVNKQNKTKKNNNKKNQIFGQDSKGEK